MSFDWKGYLELAKALDKGALCCSEEARLRSGVSRAYYGAFLCCRNYARDHEGFMPKYKSEDKTRVENHLQYTGYPLVAQHLASLRKWRNDCDYEDVVNNVRLLYESAIANACEVISSLQ